MSNLFCIQHKKTKCYFLFISTDENCDTDADKIISSKSNKYFDIDDNVDNYKIGEVNDFNASIITEINNKSGSQYDNIKSDDYCINVNLDKCIELLNKKLSVKKVPKKAPTNVVEDTHKPKLAPKKCKKEESQ